jgi:sec-independent protein translocase protein TatB
VFDISFSELLVIAVVALVVIGPEKLPKVARTVGLLVGRVQRFASQVKDEVNREGRFEELQRLQGEVQQSILSVESSVSSSASTNPVDSTQGDLIGSSTSASPKPRAKKSATQAVTSIDKTAVKKQPATKTRIAKKTAPKNDEVI